MKRYLSILLAFLILSGTMRDVPSYISFKINQKYIAKYLCVNKDVPKSTCNGKCHLSKTIVENHESESSDALPLFPKSHENLVFTFSNLAWHFTNTSFILKEKINSNQFAFGYSYVSDIFHPPRLA